MKNNASWVKIVGMVLAGMMVLLTGCGGGSSDTSDTTAPTTTSVPAVTGTSATVTTLQVTINENGTGYYLVQPAAATAPTVAEVQAGTAFAMTANVAASQPITGLSASTSYKIYFVAKDAANNVQAAVQSVAVTTSAAPDTTAPGTIVVPAVSGTSATATTLTVTIDENGTGYYLVKLAAAPAPTVAEVQAGTSFAMSAITASYQTITGLSPSTAYTIYFIAKDSAGNVQAAVQSVDVTTTVYIDITPPVTLAAPAVGIISSTMISFSVTLDEDGTGYYLVLPAASLTPTVAEVMAGTPYTLTANYQLGKFITGLMPSTAYKIYFVAQDTAGNVQAAVQSVSATTTAAGSYVDQGGLTWMPISDLGTWPVANAYCSNTAINGLSGWRMPTTTELTALFASGAMNGKGWLLNHTWTATPHSANWHKTVRMGTDGGIDWNSDTTLYAISCVRYAYAPNITSPLGVSGVNESSATFTVTADKDGTGYYLVLPAADPAPTVDQVVMGASFALSANVMAQQIIGGLVFNTAYTLYFVAGDTAGNLQTNAQSLSFTTAPTTTTGFVTQGGLTWMPLSSQNTWPNANTYCTTSTINGATGWRMPTQAELQALYASGAMNGQGWLMDGWTWSSSSQSAGQHTSFALTGGGSGQFADANSHNVSCVR